MGLAEQHDEGLTKEAIMVVPYDARWPQMFEEEKTHLLCCLPRELVGRIEHVGSTAVPGLSAKPIVDMLIEVIDLEQVKSQIVPVLTAQNYEYFLHPRYGEIGPPFHFGFIKRDTSTNVRTHHLHMVARDATANWEQLLFRDYLIEHPEAARRYVDLKLQLASALPWHRAACAQAKADFIVRVTADAQRHYGRP